MNGDLRITVTDRLVFAVPADDKDWALFGDPRSSRCAVHVSDRMGEDGDFNLDWNLSIDTQQRAIFCQVMDGSQIYCNTMRRLPLRPGVITLDRLETIKNPFNARARHFRSLKLQAFLDKYGIRAIQNRSLNGKVLYGTDKTIKGFGDVPTVRHMTTCVYTDGSIYIDTGNDNFRIENSTWTLENRVDFDKDSNVLGSGYILYTRVKSLERLEKSFAKSAIYPVH